MARYVIQSAASGRFLTADSRGGEPCWVSLLQQAGGGVTDDPERIAQLVADYCDPEDFAQVVDLDRLGTPDDYLTNFEALS
ncbi:hypothetical protein [Delftia lacustris]|uniref:hypothetical protein n=1 Tax=Delftia lacustris TaxID=558537 RepID=UPI0030BB9D19